MDRECALTNPRAEEDWCQNLVTSAPEAPGCDAYLVGLLAQRSAARENEISNTLIELASRTRFELVLPP